MRFIEVILVFALVCIGVQPARGGEDCSPRDFRPALGIPRNQKDLSWCYAVASADLVTQKTGQRVSAADLATTFLMQSPNDIMANGSPEARKFLEENPDFYSELQYSRKNEAINYDRSKLTGPKGLIDAGGNASHAMFLANAKGLCLEKDLPTSDKFILSLLKEARQVHQKVARRKTQQVICVQTDNTSGLVDGVSVAISRNYQQQVDSTCKRIPLKEALIPVQTGERDIGTYLDKYKDDPEGKKRLHDKLFETMNQALDAGKALEIGYSLQSVAPDKDSNDRDADHSSVIAGRKKINGVCHYLLRNTQGPDCDYLPKYVPRCSEGHVWLTREELEPTLYEVTYLK